MPTPAPALSAVPEFPALSNRTTYNAMAYAFGTAMRVTVGPELAALAANVYSNAVGAAADAVTAQNSANTASTAASNALSASGAAVWSVATTYTVGAAVYSPINMRIYRCIVGITGGADPSANGTNWQTVNNNMLVTVVGGTTQTAVAGTQYVLTNVAATTVTLPASPQSTDEVWITVANALDTNVIARNAQTIMGLAENLTISHAYATVKLRYVNTSWRIV